VPLRSFANFKLRMSRHRKELRGALAEMNMDLDINPADLQFFDGFGFHNF